MEQQAVNEIASKLLDLSKSKTNQTLKKHSEFHFVPNDKFSDSFFSFSRKGNGLFGLGKVSYNSPISSVGVCITFKPGVFEQKWVGFTLYIRGIDKEPRLSLFRRWPETSGANEEREIDEPKETLLKIKDSIFELLELPTLEEGVEPERQAPYTMF